MDIVLATNNKNKIKEFKSLLNVNNLYSLKDMGIDEELPENGNTFIDNALQKARYVANITNKIVIADDSGLSICNLNNFPGVHSARWALPIEDYKIINEMILKKMSNNNLNSIDQRKSYFTCVIAFVDPINNVEKTFEGRLSGYISFKQKGSQGFGYDTIFSICNSDLTLAEMSFEEKNKLSHRKIACDKFIDFFKNYS
ncbi:RdgB/HAM1 family non-canonical purine NTP pyrophosphatase [Spiroplasma litorale]|uniref:RdgB/HAM1 family non-canonical purine NTP pyrophosphatase n=1 Tax=Spiroplasma litorale TaxID=216942 RepID=UPI00130D57E8|nr:RdgB/HAM1 family non-canonical purine NTP pyrophosphatase [Spiroplasma litorale]